MNYILRSLSLGRIPSTLHFTWHGVAPFHMIPILMKLLVGFAQICAICENAVHTLGRSPGDGDVTNPQPMKLFHLSILNVHNLIGRESHFLPLFNTNNLQYPESRKLLLHSTFRHNHIRLYRNPGSLDRLLSKIQKRKLSTSIRSRLKSHSKKGYSDKKFARSLQLRYVSSNRQNRKLLQEKVSKLQAVDSKSNSFDESRSETNAEFQGPPKKSSFTSSNTRIAVRFTVRENFNLIAEGRTGDLENHLRQQLAREVRLPLSSIQNLKVEPGTDISFVASVTNDVNNVMDDKTVTEAVEDLKSRIRRKSLKLTDLDGRQLTPVSDGIVMPKGEKMDFTPAILGILIAVMIFMLVLIILAGVLVRNTSRIERGTTTKMRTKAYRPITVQEGRESSQSIGRYSYDSGLWMGPGPEPLHAVPEAPLYRPPTADQVASTPRPVTAVRTRLKRNWNIDAHQPLTPSSDDEKLPREVPRSREERKGLETISETYT